METTTLVLLALCLSLATGCLFSTLYCVSLNRKLRRELVDAQQAQRSDLRALAGGTVSMGKRLRKLEQKLNMTVTKQQELEFRDAGNAGYAHAGKLAEMGVARDDLVNTCGLSAAEAELFMLMHKKRPGLNASGAGKGR